jgi:hypothetical protein
MGRRSRDDAWNTPSAVAAAATPVPGADAGDLLRQSQSRASSPIRNKSNINNNNNNNRSSKIPIPSFVPFPSAVSPPSGSTSKNNSSSNKVKQTATTAASTTSTARLLRLPVRESWMTKLESALQLHRRQNATVSYADFCKCASRLVLDSGDVHGDGSSSRLNPLGGVAAPAASAPAARGTTTTTTTGGTNQDGPATATMITDLPDDSPVLGLSREERLWHDLYCVAVPTLYLCSDDGCEGKDRRRTHPIGELRVASLPPGGNRWKELRRLVQNAAARSGGISAEKSQRAVSILHSLRPRRTKDGTATRTVGMEDHEGDIIVVRRPTTEKSTTTTVDENPPSSSKMTTTATSSLLESLFGTVSTSSSLISTNKHKPDTTTNTTTLEDRIRARAAERERNVQQVEAAQRDPREDRVAVADTLYSHAKHILRRSRSSSIAGRTTTSCVLTFRDVRTVLRKWSKQQVTALLLDIVRVAPGWIRWMDPQWSGGDKKDGSNSISKDATVWVETADYKRVRRILNGENPARPPPPLLVAPPPPSSSRPPPPPISPQLSELTLVAVTKTATAAPRSTSAEAAVVTVPSQEVPSQAIPFGHEQDGRSSSSVAIGKKRPAPGEGTAVEEGGSVPIRRPPPKSLKALAGAAARTNQLVADESRNPGDRRSIVHPETSLSPSPRSGTKRPPSRTGQDGGDEGEVDEHGRPVKTARRTTVPQSRVVRRRRQSWSLNETSSSEEEEEEEEEANSGDRHHQKGMSVPEAAPARLRINENLILCDADYDGGTVIQPSLDLPRGLRRLFLALNAGERI